MQAPPSRIPPLDGLRGLAAASVLLYHVLHATWPDALVAPAPPALRYALHDLGSNGVATFFVLSGFLLGLPFVAWLTGFGPAVDLPRYARARILRIFPAWWLVLAVVLVVAAPELLRDPRRLLLLATLQQNYDPALLRRLVPPAWTLVIEVSFYAALPLVAVAAAPALRRVARRRRPPLVALGLVALAVPSTLFQWRWLDPAQLPHPDLRTASYSLPAFADHFLLGTLAALGLLALGGLPRRFRRPLAPALAAAGVALFWASLDALRAEHGPQSRTGVAAGVALLILGLSLLEPVGRPARVLSAHPLRTLGPLSYGVYLWHLPLQYALVHEGIVRRGGLPETLAALVLVGGGALALAALSFRLVEGPALRRVGRPRSVAAEPAPVDTADVAP